MGAKPSKSSDDPPSTTRSFINSKKKRTSHNLRAVLSPISTTGNNNKKKDTVISKPNDHNININTTKTTTPPTTTTTTTTTLLSTPSSSPSPLPCTTAHKLPIPIVTTTANPSIITTPQKRSSPSPSHTSSIHYDPLKSSKKSRRKNTPSNASNHVSLISTTSTTNDLNTNKSSMSSSGWTTLSNDPFSQIEAANTSAFTEITDQSTISRKSLYPVLESSHSLLLSPPSYTPSNVATNNSPISALTSQMILSQLAQCSEDRVSDVIREAYKKAQQQSDPFDWHQFYIAMEEYNATTKSYIGLVYLARCLIAGLGVSLNVERGIEILKSNPSCETTYALGHCYLDGLPSSTTTRPQGVDKKAAFKCFQLVIQKYTSPISTIAEAQCTLARLLFQGEGVQQDTSQALELLMKSAENNNM